MCIKDKKLVKYALVVSWWIKLLNNIIGNIILKYTINENGDILLRNGMK